MLCPQVLHGMASSLKQTGLHTGRDYDVIVASIDPSDTPASATEAKQHFLMMLNDPSAANSVHFLTGQQTSITDFAEATGFHYVRVPGPDGKMNQFAHSSVIMIATPDGRMSKYLSGVEYQPRDVRLALVEASDHKIGSLTDLVILYCCNYVPSQGRYTVAVMRVLGLAAMGSVFMLIGRIEDGCEYLAKEAASEDPDRPSENEPTSPPGPASAAAASLPSPQPASATGLLIHPVIQPRLLEPPAIPQLERRNEILGGILIERIRTDTQIVRRLPDVHYFPNLTAHNRCFHRRPSRNEPPMRGDKIPGHVLIPCFALAVQEISAIHRFIYGILTPNTGN